jgi:hypothetical protein
MQCFLLICIFMSAFWLLILLEMQRFLLICIFLSVSWLLILLEMQRFLLICIFISAFWLLILLEIRWFQLNLLILSVSRIQLSFNLQVTASALFNTNAEDGARWSCGPGCVAAAPTTEDGVRWKKKKVRWTFFPPNRPTKPVRARRP